MAQPVEYRLPDHLASKLIRAVTDEVFLAVFKEAADKLRFDIGTLEMTGVAFTAVPLVAARPDLPVEYHSTQEAPADPEAHQRAQQRVWWITRQIHQLQNELNDIMQKF